MWHNLRMKKEIIYLIEYLSKSPNVGESELYREMSATLASLEIYTPSKYDQEQIKTLMTRMGVTPPVSFEDAVVSLDKVLENALPSEISQMKKSIFHTLIASNFPKKKAFLDHSYAFFISQLEPVEKSIYDNLTSYVVSLNRAFGVFYVLCQDETMLHQPETFVAFGNALHVKLLSLIYNEEEQSLLENGLRELLGVYLGLYGKYLYM